MNDNNNKSDGIIQPNNTEEIQKITSALIMSEKRYRRLFESAKDGILILDAESGMIVDVNPFLIELLGYSKEQFIDKAIWEIGFFKDIIANKDKFIELQKKEYVRYEDLPIETANGRKINVEFVSNVYLVNKHKVIQCNIRDITERKQSEKALRKSKEEYETLVENANEAIVVVQDDLMKYANPKTQEITGYSNKELLSNPFLDFVYYDDRSLVRMNYKLRLRDDKTPPQYKFRILTKEGNIKWVNISSVLIEWHEKPATLNFLTDITSKIKSQEALKVSETSYRRLFESAKDGILILDALTGMIVDVNPFLIKLLGYSKEQFIDKSIWEIGFFKDIVANREKFIELQKKEYVRYENLPLETANGRKIHVEFVSNVYLVNHHKVIQCNIRDISDRKHAESAFIASEMRYRRLFESAKDGILILDAESGMIVDVNPFLITLLGYSKEQFIDKAIWDIGFFKDIIANKDKFIELQQKEYVRYEDLPLETAGGRKIHVEFVSNVYLANNHKVIQCNIRDITERKRAEEDLSRVNSFLDSIIENIPNMVFIKEAKELRFVRFNKSGEILLGIPSQEIIGKNDYDFFSKEQADFFIEKDRDVLKFKKMIDIPEEQIQTKHQGIRILHTKKVPILNEMGEQEYLLGISEDITDRNMAEKALKESEEKYRFLVDKSTENIWTRDLKLKYTYISPSIIRLTGFTVEEEMERTIDQCYTPKTIQLISETFAEEMELEAKGTADPTRNRTIELETYKKDGSIAFLETSMTFLRDDKLMAYGIYGITRDITERKKAEKIIKENEIQYQNLADSGSALIWTSDTNKLCNYFNKPWLEFTGKTLEQELGNGWADGVHRLDIEKCFQTFVTAFDKREKFYMEYRILHNSGEYRWISDMASPVYGTNGEFTGYIGHCFDITERKAMENELISAKEQAEESDKLKTAFLQNMSHEIRTPLNGIIGFSKLLNTENLSKEDIIDYTSVISLSGKRLLEVVNDILDISRIQTGQVIIENKQFSINSIFSDLLTFFSHIANSKNITLNYHGSDIQNAFIISDESRLYQILTNLINNAIKFTESGSIDFGYEFKENLIEFYVKDTGIGISPDLFERIFDRFTQADMSISRGYEGTGLGLSISKGLLELLGGKIWFESELNKGTTFFFTLPYTPKDIISQAEPIYSDETNKIIRGKILVAEDDLVSFQYLNNLLEKLGLKVIRAENGVQAVEIIKRIPDIDLILMDIRMPVMDGIEATKLIKEIKPDICIIAQTAYAFTEERLKILSIGCDDYLSKPLDSNKVIELINKYLD